MVTQKKENRKGPPQPPGMKHDQKLEKQLKKPKKKKKAPKPDKK